MVEINIDGEILLPSVGKTWNNLYVPVSTCFECIPMGLCEGSLLPTQAAYREAVKPVWDVVQLKETVIFFCGGGGRFTLSKD